jgi:hypothetical protein
MNRCSPGIVHAQFDHFIYAGLSHGYRIQGVSEAKGTRKQVQAGCPRLAHGEPLLFVCMLLSSGVGLNGFSSLDVEFCNYWARLGGV